MPVKVDLVGCHHSSKNISSFALSNLNSGIIVRFPILKFGESVRSNMLVAGAADNCFFIIKIFTAKCNTKCAGWIKI